MKSVSISMLGVFIVFIILSVSPSAHSQQGLLESSSSVDLSETSASSYLNLMVGLRKYLNSFTSWQLPANAGPQDPISRLEYPWDQTFLAVRCSTAYTGLEINLEWSGTLSTLSNPKAQDSDWEDPQNASQKTTFSEAEAKPRCWMADLSFNVAIPGFSFMRGVAGYRVSQFKFTNTDGYQFGIYDSGVYEWYSLPLPGPSIEFSQYYKHLYAGGILDTSINLSKIFNGLTVPPLLVRIQADASYVTANSHDQHLLRYAFGIIRSRGYGWHLNLTTGLKTGRLRFDIEGDVRGIRTSGGIQSIMEDQDNPGLFYDISFDGAKAWSEQKYLGINGTIIF